MIYALNVLFSFRMGQEDMYIYSPILIYDSDISTIPVYNRYAIFKMQVCITED